MCGVDELKSWRSWRNCSRRSLSGICFALSSWSRIEGLSGGGWRVGGLISLWSVRSREDAESLE